MASRLCPFCMKMSDGDTCPHCGKNSKYANQPLHLPAGFVVSGKHPYVLGAALGQGGFGITYIALDMVTNTRVAIKEYFPTHCSGRTANHSVTAYQNQAEVFQKGKVRFLDEAKTLKSLSDLKSIVNVLDFFEANNSAYLVMEFLEGISLKDYAARKGRFPARKFLSQMKPLMEDIQRMHERGVIHRDIAPDNIILMPDGRMKLIDFGAARSYVSGKSLTMVVKKGFAPVEQYLSHGSTASTDVYALAATVYYCITGKVPPDSADREYAGLALASPRSLGADLTPQQEKAILKAMKVQQKERTQSVKAFLEDLNKKRGILLLPRSRKLLLLILAALAAIVLLLGVFLLTGDKEPLPPDPPVSKPVTATKAPEEAETTDDEFWFPEAPEAEKDGKSSADKAPSNKPSGSGSSGDSSSGDSSSGGSSSGGSSSGGSSSETTPPTGSPSYNDSDSVSGGGGSGLGGIGNDHGVPDNPAERPDNNSSNNGSSGGYPSDSGSSDSGSSDSGSSGGGTTGGDSSGGNPSGGNPSGGSSGDSPEPTGGSSSGGATTGGSPSGGSSSGGGWNPGGSFSGGSFGTGSFGGL